MKRTLKGTLFWRTSHVAIVQFDGPPFLGEVFEVIRVFSGCRRLSRRSIRSSRRWEESSRCREGGFVGLRLFVVRRLRV